MFSSNLFTSVLALVLASRAASVQRRAPDGPTDVQILNYALTLEHLEYAFYDEALSRFDEKTFGAAGLNRSLFQAIAAHEYEHVTFLSEALGGQATKPCNYSFPYTDVKGFAALSMVLEGVGVSAYLGAAGYIRNPNYLTAAGSILSTEARHAAYVSSVSTNYQAPWSTSFDTPLDLNQVYSLAAPFITSCPPNNPTLPVKRFPALNLTTTNYTAGSTLEVSVAENATANANANNHTQLYVAFLTGLRAIYAPYDSQAKSVVIPANLTQIGTVYAVLTSTNASDGSAPTDDTTMAGPVILVFPNNGTEGIVGTTGKTETPKSGGAEKVNIALGCTAFFAFVAGAVAVTL